MQNHTLPDFTPANIAFARNGRSSLVPTPGGLLRRR